MEKFTNSLPEFFYDLIGIFIPGFYLYFCFSLIYAQSTLTGLIKISFINETVTTIFLLYLLGHVIYTFGSFFVAKTFNKLTGNPVYFYLGQPKTRWNKVFDDILFMGVKNDRSGYYKRNVEMGIRQVSNYETFSLTNADNTPNIDAIDTAYEVCRNYVMEKTQQRAGIIRKEQSYGEMSRGIIFVSFFCIVWIVAKQIEGSKTDHFWYILLFFSISFICFAYRYTQARRINPIFIYSTFCSLVNDSQNNNQNNED